ncbi:2-oxoacid:acceptor oxidoreductase family protein [candidate division KSB1 bacterium]
MLEIRFHGRGGQGAVIASEMLAAMYFESGKYVQAFPAFGVERRGAPVLAYTRVDKDPIEIHYGIYSPDQLVVLDQTILEMVDVTNGLKKGGCIIINTDKTTAELGIDENYVVFPINVNAIAEHFSLGTSSLPIVNTAILGAYAAATKGFSLDLVEKVILESVPSKKEANAEAAKVAFETIIQLRQLINHE